MHLCYLSLFHRCRVDAHICCSLAVIAGGRNDEMYCICLSFPLNAVLLPCMLYVHMQI